MINKQDYLKAIGLDSALADATPSLDLLNKIIYAQITSFRFQTVAIYHAGQLPIEQRKVPALTPEALTHHFIVNKAPGYCFQLNEVLALVLESLGFELQRHLARVISKKSSEFISAKDIPNIPDHLALVVIIANTQYLVDVGFAYQSLRSALPLNADELVCDRDQYRVSQLNDGSLIELQLQDEEWLCLYIMDNKPVSAPEVHVAHELMYRAPECVPVRDKFFLAARITSDQRKYICAMKEGQAFYKVHNRDKTTIEKPIQSQENFDDLIERELDMKTDFHLNEIIKL